MNDVASHTSPRIAPLAPLLLLVALGGLVLWLQGLYLVDDAYITFRYAVNLAAGHGPVWNPGEHVEGYTNPLWMLMLTPPARAGIDLVWPAATASLLFALGCLELLRRIGRRLWPDRPLLALLAPLLLATNPSFAYWSVMGMESPAFAFWILLASHLLLQGRERPRLRRRAGLVLAAASLTRPEGPLVAAVLLLVEVAAERGPLPGRVGRLLAPALIVSATVLAQLAFRLWYYGDPLPNTFYAKVIFGWVTAGRGAAHLGLFLLKGGFVALPGLLVLRRARAPLRPYLVHGYAVLLIYALYLVVVGGDFPGWYRFYLPLLPLPLLGCAELLGRVGARIAGATRRGALALLVVALPSAVVWPFAEARTIPMIRDGGRKNELLNRYFFGPQVPDDALVAAFTVGMLGYYNRFRVLDGWGLNNRHLAHIRPYPARQSVFGHEKSDMLFVLSQRPDYIFARRPGPPLPLKGHEVCWPTWLLPDVIYRRVTPLGPDQLGLGMPHGMRRTLGLTPPCALPVKGAFRTQPATPPGR